MLLNINIEKSVPSASLERSGDLCWKPEQSETVTRRKDKSI